MPKVLTYTPEWLSRPNPGFQLFNTPGPRQALAQPGRRGSTQHENLNNGGVEYVGPNKIIARRGTEIFVVVAGKFIRWSDLSTLKTQYEELQATLSKNPRGNRYQIETDDETKGPEDLSYRVQTLITTHR